MELKQQIIAELGLIEDDQLFKEIQGLLRVRKEKLQHVVPMSAAMRERVARGKQQVQEGKVVPHEVVAERMKKWED